MLRTYQEMSWAPRSKNLRSQFLINSYVATVLVDLQRFVAQKISSMNLLLTTCSGCPIPGEHENLLPSCENPLAADWRILEDSIWTDMASDSQAEIGYQNCLVRHPRNFWSFAQAGWNV